jgi:hypothetical protein
MLRLIEGLPADIPGVEATEKATHENYQRLLIPAAEARMAKGPINMLYVTGSTFSGYELEALWDDGAFGVKHWHEFRRIAVVTDSAWLRAAVTTFSPFFPGEIRLFKSSELAGEKAWITSLEKAGA